MVILAAAAKWFAALFILLDTVQGSSSGCAKGHYKDPDHGTCIRCPYCAQKYWTSRYYFNEECAHNNTEPVVIYGYEYRSWCRPGPPLAHYDVCEFPVEFGGLVNCTNGPLYGHECTLTCNNGQVSTFTCQSNSSQLVATLCQSVYATTSEGLPPSTTTTTTSTTTTTTSTEPPGVGALQPGIIVVIAIAALLLAVLLMVAIVCMCRCQRKRASGSNDDLTVKIGPDGRSTSITSSEPSSSDSLLSDSKEEKEKDAGSHIVAMSTPGATTGVLRAPGYFEGVPSHPESSPPPYTFVPCSHEMNRLQGQCFWDTSPDESITVPKVPVESNTHAGLGQTPRSGYLQVFSGLKGDGRGNEAVMTSPSHLSLPEDLELTVPEPEPVLDPEECSVHISELFTARQLRPILTDLQLALEPLDSRDPALTMTGLSMHCLGWSRDKADQIRWAYRENLQQTPAFVTLRYMSEEGLKFGHIALYFSKRGHRNMNIVKLLKSATTHQQCPFCSRL